MSEMQKKYCVYGCDFLVTFGVPSHRFPHPEKDPELFDSWLSVIGDKIKESDRMKIYKNKRICDYHFHPSTKIFGGRLNKSAIPSVYLHRVRQSCTTFIELDHCYSPPERECFRPAPMLGITNRPGPSRLAVDSLEIPIPSGSVETTCVVASDMMMIAYDADDGESADNTHLNEKPIFSWQEGELIETVDPDNPTPAPVPRIPEEATTLSLFCEQDEDEVTQTEPAQVVPEGDEYQCKDCTQVIDGFSWWCVQCSGARCGACAALSPHRAHYVLRAPHGSRRSQTEAVLANIRQQLLNENLPLFDVDDDGVKVEVKSESEEPAHLAPDLPPAPPDPLSDEPLTHLVLLPPGPQANVESSPAPPDPLSDEPLTHLVLLPPGPQANVDSSNTAEQLDDHHLFKRPRLMNYQPIAPKATETTNLVTPKLSQAKTNELSLLGILQNKKGSEPHMRPQQSILNTHSASNQSDSRGVQLRVKQSSRGPQLLPKGARHIQLVNGSPQLVVVQQYSEGSQLRKITDNHPLGSQILRKVQNLPKGQPLLKDLDLQSSRAHTSKERIHAAVKVTSKAQAPDLENVDDEVEFLDEEILDSEAENRDRNRIDEEQGDEDRDSEEGDTIDDRADHESRVESEIEDLEIEVGDIIEDRIDQESNIESEMESEIGEYRTDRPDQESYIESEMDDDDDLDKDYRVEDDSVDETDVEDALERSVLTRTAARVPIRGPQEEMVRKLPAVAMVQLRPLTSLDISQWTTGSED